MDRETELKLTVLPEHLDQLRRHPILRASVRKGASTKRLVSTYYDTPAFALMRQAVALRVRKDGAARVQTVKHASPGEKGRITRFEWEKRISGDRPDISALDDPKLRRLIRSHESKAKLKPVFVTDVRRQVWPLRVGSSKIECALDVGEIKANGRRKPLCEVELELKSGAPGKLFELARRLNQSVPLRLEPVSKAARGYHLALGVSPAPEKAKPVHLTPEMTVHEAFVVTARSCIEHIVANVDSAHDGKDPEGIHQLRVGIRRLRAALSIFKAAVPAGGRNALGGELRWLQQELGPAREWDVFINETLSRVVRHCGGADFSPLVGAAEAKRAEAYARARSVLGDRRYTDLLLRLEAWLESGLREGDTEGNPRESRHEDVGVAPAPGFASEILRMRQAKVQKHGRKIRSLGDEGIHDLRIRVKKLRYATEFFRGLYGEKPTKRYLARLKDLQDILGNVHDVFVAQALVPQLAGMVGEGVPLALGQVQGWCAARRQGDLGRLVSAWKAFSSLKPFWKDHAP